MPVFTFGRLDTALAQLRGDLTQPAFLAHARARTARDEDGLRSVALGAYLVARLAERLLTGAEDDESTTWQLASTIRYVADLPPDDPETRHLRAVLDALGVLRLGERSALRASLHAYGAWLECDGRLSLALDALRLAARTWPDEIPPADFSRLALAVGRVNRQLGRLDLAADAYAAAGDAAALASAEADVARAALGAIAVRRLQGQLVGLDCRLAALLEQAESCTALAEIAPLVHAERGALDAARGRVTEAAGSLLAAAQAASRLSERMQIMEGLAQVLAVAGASDAARLLLRHVAAVAPERVTRVRAELELMEMASAEGDRLTFERLRGSVKPLAPALPPPLQVEFCFRAGLGLSRFGQHARAMAAWREGATLAGALGLASTQETIERLLGSLDECRHVEVEQAGAPLLDIRALESDVRALVLSAGA